MALENQQHPHYCVSNPEGVETLWRAIDQVFARKTDIGPGGGGGGGSYTLPVASNMVLGGIKTGYSQSGKNYPVKVDSSGNAYVNVPWEGGSGGGSSFDPSYLEEDIQDLQNEDTSIWQKLNELEESIGSPVDLSGYLKTDTVISSLTTDSKTIPGAINELDSLISQLGGGGEVEPYVLPAASADTRGGIRVGEGLEVTDTDKLNVSEEIRGYGDRITTLEGEQIEMESIVDEIIKMLWGDTGTGTVDPDKGKPETDDSGNVQIPTSPENPYDPSQPSWEEQYKYKEGTPWLAGTWYRKIVVEYAADGQDIEVPAHHFPIGSRLGVYLLGVKGLTMNSFKWSTDYPEVISWDEGNIGSNVGLGQYYTFHIAPSETARVANLKLDIIWNDQTTGSNISSSMIFNIFQYPQAEDASAIGSGTPDLKISLPQDSQGHYVMEMDEATSTPYAYNEQYTGNPVLQTWERINKVPNPWNLTGKFGVYGSYRKLYGFWCPTIDMTFSVGSPFPDANTLLAQYYTNHSENRDNPSGAINQQPTADIPVTYSYPAMFNDYDSPYGEDVQDIYDTSRVTLTYSVDNAYSNDSVEVVSDSDWIKTAAPGTLGEIYDEYVSDSNIIEFAVYDNPSSSQRTGTVTVTYKYGDNQSLQKTINVIQKGADKWLNPYVRKQRRIVMEPSDTQGSTEIFIQNPRRDGHLVYISQELAGELEDQKPVGIKSLDISPSPTQRKNQSKPADGMYAWKVQVNAEPNTDTWEGSSTSANRGRKGSILNFEYWYEQDKKKITGIQILVRHYDVLVSGQQS